MQKFHTIMPVNADPFMITWDTGRRCNFDCSYCPAHRHDNFSNHASLQDLKHTAEFLFEYIETIAQHRINKDFHVSFTGGEPTVNPNFIELVEYMRSRYTADFDDKFNLYMSLTTNGAMGEKMAATVAKNFEYVTVSYHCEAHVTLKEQVRRRLLDLNNAGTKLKVNVMFHAEHFDECKELCTWLTDNCINFIPRTIGDDPDSAYSQAHRYSQDQKQWFEKYWNIDLTPTNRPCCGGRSMGLCGTTGNTESKIVNFREFKDWHCSVNWYFLHIEQQTKLIYHHQTCQARLDGTRGPIGSLESWKNIVANLRISLEQKSIPIIVCPNKICGCGLCTPKSENRHTLLEVMPAVIKDISVFSAN